MKRKLYIACGCLAALLILFFTVDPNKMPSFMLVVPFILLFIILFVAMSLLLEQHSIEGKKNSKITALCVSLPILLLVLQSIGQLTLRDVITVALLFVLSFFYISRSTVSS